MVATACLIMPDDIGTTPGAANVAPAIQLSTLDPGPELGILTFNSACLQEEHHFTAYVTDPDNATLYYRVFIDYPASPSPATEGAVTQAVSDDKPLAEITFSIRIVNPSFTLPLESGAHTVELLVSDQQFLFGGPTFRAVPEGAGEDSYQWTVEMVNLGAGTCGS
jgi:hypothetical protein